MNSLSCVLSYNYYDYAALLRQLDQEHEQGIASKKIDYPKLSSSLGKIYRSRVAVGEKQPHAVRTSRLDDHTLPSSEEVTLERRQLEDKKNDLLNELI